jgi:energy-coupling factor transporter ATP-binding protein EcfA2
VSSNEEARKVEKDIAHIFGLQDFQVNAGPEEKTLQMFVNDRSFRLDEVGSGMAQFLIVLANAAMKKPSYILIDEPELNLHPSLQIDFITTLASYATRGVIYATHSLGLARATAENIYSLRKHAAFESRISSLETTPRLAEFLGEMSFGGYRELGFDKVLLLEGVTDVLAIQQLLRKFQLDHKVVLLPLGGSAMINGKSETELQLTELTRISTNIVALIDSEREDATEPLCGDRQAFIDVCKRVGIYCHVLERRAVENYWTTRSIQIVKGPNARALAHHERLTDQWGKRENWLIARRMTEDEFAATDLGQFLRRLGP